MIRRLVFTAATLAVLSLAPVMAHPGHEQKVMGTVTMTAADHVMLKTPDGKDTTIQITKNTRFMKAKKAMKAADMKTGMRVVVTAVTNEDDTKLIAQVIEMGEAPATK